MASGLFPLKKLSHCSPGFAGVRISSRVLLSTLLYLATHLWSIDLGQLNETKRFTNMLQHFVKNREKIIKIHITFLIKCLLIK